MCRIAAEDGVTGMVATPHMLDGMYNTGREAVQQGIAALQRELGAHSISLRLFPGGDVHADPRLPEMVANNTVLTVADNHRYVLVELSRDVIPSGIEETFFALKVRGVTPILTHPERHPAFQEDPSRLAALGGAGNLVQITAGSVTGDFGRAAERCAHTLIARRMAHLVATDAHDPVRRAPRLSGARRVIEELAGQGEAATIFDDRPRQVVAGHDVTVPDPAEEPRLAGWRRIWPWR